MRGIFPSENFRSTLSISIYLSTIMTRKCKSSLSSNWETMELLRYVEFIKDEKVKIQPFLSGLTTYYKYKIYYDEPKNSEESIRKDHCLYEDN